MAEQPGFIRLQRQFTAHIRDPHGNPPPADVEERRMAVYRDLLYNNVEGFVAGAFPVLRRLYADDAWHRLVRGFFARHRCRTPLFLEISREFLRYLEETHRPGPDDPPFLRELAHYEWVEVALSIADVEPDLSGVDPDADLLDSAPVLSPLAWPLTYRFPVHRICPEFRPDAPGDQPTHLLVLRDRDDRVRFNEINAVTARLLELLRSDQEPAATGRTLLHRIAAELRHPDPQAVLAGGREILETLRSQGAVLGGRSI